MNSALLAHLAQGSTTICRLWLVTRRDGQCFGFTDHDCDLTIADVLYRADAGLSASALQQSTGLSVDNSEALGVLSDDAVTAQDLRSGRFDGAEVRIWRANWRDLSARHEIFRGYIGEVVLHGAAFRAELRGLSERLGQDQGRSYTRACAALLGDVACGFDLTQPGYQLTLPLSSRDPEARILQFDAVAGFDPGWFSHGRVDVLDGAARGLWGMVKADRSIGPASRQLELWQAIRAPLAPGDLIRLSAGCDKQPSSCRLKFGNFLNFRGFPHLPTEDWLAAYPRAGDMAEGGSLFPYDNGA